MPIYEYQCSECSHTLEAIQSFSDPALTDCPTCGKSSLKKLVSAPSFRLAGNGWYETDFKTGNKKNIAGDADSSDGSSNAIKGKEGKEGKDKTSKADKSSSTD